MRKVKKLDLRETEINELLIFKAFMYSFFNPVIYMTTSFHTHFKCSSKLSPVLCLYTYFYWKTHAAKHYMEP